MNLSPCIFYSKIRDGGIELHGLYPFTIEFKDGKSIVVAATSFEDKLKWTEVCFTLIAVSHSHRHFGIVCSSVIPFLVSCEYNGLFILPLNLFSFDH